MNTYLRCRVLSTVHVQQLKYLILLKKRESNQVVVEVSIKGLYVNFTVLAYGKM